MGHIRAVVLCLLSITGLAMPALAKTADQAPPSIIDTLVFPAIISLLVGGLTAFFTTSFKLKEFRAQSEIQQEMEKKREEEKNRIQYLNPLRISAEDLERRLKEIVNDMINERMKIRISADFEHINENNIANRREFEKWCNIDGYFCMATIYITSVYFSRANKLRSEFPIAQLDPADDEELLGKLSRVRTSFGGRYGIWETIQDSLGSYTRKSDDSLMNYREFCGEISDSNKHVWFRSLIDFYVNFHMKLEYEVPSILKSLEELVKFLRDTQKRKSNQA
jgi:hypothetical protein